MEHLSDSQLLDVLAATPDDREASARHLAECDHCRERLDALRQGWDLLGDWTIEERTVDLTDRIMANARSVRTIRLRQPQAVVRIAASIAIGVALGALAARPDPASVSDRQVTEAMYLDALTLHSATGWTSPLLADPEEE